MNLYPYFKRKDRIEFEGYDLNSLEIRIQKWVRNKHFISLDNNLGNFECISLKSYHKGLAGNEFGGLDFNCLEIQGLQPAF